MNALDKPVAAVSLAELTARRERLPDRRLGRDHEAARVVQLHRPRWPTRGRRRAAGA